MDIIIEIATMYLITSIKCSDLNAAAIEARREINYAG